MADQRVKYPIGPSRKQGSRQNIIEEVEQFKLYDYVSVGDKDTISDPKRFAPTRFFICLRLRTSSRRRQIKSLSAIAERPCSPYGIIA